MNYDRALAAFTGLTALATSFIAFLTLRSSWQVGATLRLLRTEFAFLRAPVVRLEIGEPHIHEGLLCLAATFRETSGQPARLRTLSVLVETPVLDPPGIGPPHLTFDHVRYEVLWGPAETEIDRRLDEIRRHDLWVKVPQRILYGHDPVDVVFTYTFSHDRIRWHTETWQTRKSVGLNPDDATITRGDLDPSHSFHSHDHGGRRSWYERWRGARPSA